MWPFDERDEKPKVGELGRVSAWARALDRWRARFWRSQPRQTPTDDDLRADRAERA